ncbi:agamous-like MADS-box AGL80 [Olea europaea subsp. europaea]|uniref:Agamous-like MADS-box AGL80 n=1 Tax=Olea europaea subsp. europaea TaxID=158383 RepID=A0A8S0PVY0_OLEEU|nr:agamous-like MADS-box AGL80 [Olea europaea subsp. europaea]
MTRRKIKLKYIENNTDRKSSFKKRKNGILKKVQELSILCGVDACAMIYSPYEAEPFVWPSPLETQQIISRFQALPEAEKTRKMFDQVSSIDQRIRKSRVRIQKLQRDNRIKDTEILMHQCMAGFTSLQNVSLSHLIEMGCLADQKMRDIAIRMKELQTNGMVHLQIEGNSLLNFSIGEP